MNGFALGLGLKRRLRATQKWANVYVCLNALFLIVTPEEKLSTIPGEVKFDRDRDILFIRCQV